jgi:hypothetical protein
VQYNEKFEQSRQEEHDFCSKLVGWASISGWLIFIAILVLVQYARPEMNSGLVRYYNITIRTEWLPQLSDLIFLLLCICCGISISSLVFNHYRVSNNSGNHLYNLILLGLISIVGALLMLPVILRVH